VTTLVIIISLQMNRDGSKSGILGAQLMQEQNSNRSRQNKSRTSTELPSPAHFFRHSSSKRVEVSGCRFLIFISYHLGREGPDSGSDGPRSSLDTPTALPRHAFLKFLCVFSSIPSRWVGMLARLITQTNHARHEDQISASTSR
jgi:hypothetical protein